MLMIGLLVSVGAVILSIQAFIGIAFFISCIWEKESRAAIFAAIQSAGMLALLGLYLGLVHSGFFKTNFGLGVLAAGYIIAAVATLALVLRIGVNERALKGTEGLIVGEVERFDERDHVFARNRSIRPGMEQYEFYYREHPDREEFDSDRRLKGGPLGPPGIIDKAGGIPNMAAALASLSMPVYLSTPEKINPQCHVAMKDKKIELTPEEATERVKGYTIHLGASVVGIAEINPLWVYSRRGEIFHNNWEDWGKEIKLEHKYAIVFGEEMSLSMVGSGPHTPTTIESMGNYAKGAFISTQLAAFISNLGYPATANHLRHYDAILPALAVDAGLGELGRLGYLITKEFGPRLRLNAVTTDLPLIADKPVDIGVEDFCTYCKKCSVCCPSRSIPVDDSRETNGTLRWKLNDETCFSYWGKIGTDCSICMKVCPWSHARTFPHRLIVWLISRNKLSRRVFKVMDDIFYGNKPRPKAPPRWARFH
jgi:reductive dehalogenase